LVDYKFQQHFKAGNGQHGMGSHCQGKNGNDKILLLPLGTQIYADDNETLLADLTIAGEEVLLLRGGNGGWGNARFKSSTNQAPKHANPGQPAQEAHIRLRLKLIADGGIIGMPNAGKSTFLSVISNARPKIAGYPFTTLYPNLGVAEIDNDRFVLADIPGLIEGAGDGRGLGDRFLGHVERTSVLLHLLDGTEDNIVENYKIIRKELEKYNPEIAAKPEIVALNKCDSISDEDIKEKQSKLAEVTGQKIYLLSGVAKTGLDAILRELNSIIRDHKQKIHEAQLAEHDDANDIKNNKQGIISDYTIEKMAFMNAHLPQGDDDDEGIFDIEDDNGVECIYVKG